MKIPQLTKDLAVITKLSDLPNSTDGLTAAQLKAKFDEAALEIQSWINNSFLPALQAKNIPFQGSPQVNAEDLQSAVELVHSQIRDAASGTIVNGSVTREKLAEELLKRVFGGRPWVSLNAPTRDKNPDTLFPVGQLWLRPGFTVTNAAGDQWTAIGCTTVSGEQQLTVTGDKTLATAVVTQNRSSIGQEGDRVFVLFGIKDRDVELTELSLSLNGGEAQQVTDGGTFATVLTADGSLQVQLTAQWPATSLAGGSFVVEHFTVVNVDQILRQTMDTEDMEDWGAFLQTLLPLTDHENPREVYIQTVGGLWEQLDFEVFPVNRGGTGLSALGAGELPVGSGGKVMDRLSTPSSDGSFLQFLEGKPRWQTGSEAAVSMGALRVQTGTYTGNGVRDRVITLPVTPVLLTLHPQSGPASHGDDYWDGVTVLPNGAKKVEKAINVNDSFGNDSSYEVTAELVGTELTFSWAKTGLETQDRGRTTALGNRSGVVYQWTAIY